VRRRGQEEREENAAALLSGRVATAVGWTGRGDLVAKQEIFNPETFHLRGLHPLIAIGTASDRYAGWLGQIYSSERYTGQITRRSHAVGGRAFVEEVLPVESVEEYFDHFRVLELDFTFYRFLLEEDGRPTQNYHVLRKYRQHMGEDDALILKVPQVIFARKLHRGGSFIVNEAYLNPDIFRRCFFEPAQELLGPTLRGFIFEQEYQRQKERTPPADLASALDAFFGAIPTDNRYHVELRTESYLSKPVFETLARHGVGQVLSHWTWLPLLRTQFAKSGGAMLNSGKRCIVRLMTPRGVRYEDAYARAHPFNALVDDMLDPKMVEETVELMRTAVDRGVQIYVIVNNRAGGNAPLIARQVAERFAAGSREV
jgi:uncharacterized protein YecE (DUF72 family)